MIDQMAITTDSRRDATITIQAAMFRIDGLNFRFELVMSTRRPQNLGLIIKRAAGQLRNMQQVCQGQFMPQFQHYVRTFRCANFFDRTKALTFFKYATSARNR